MSFFKLIWSSSSLVNHFSFLSLRFLYFLNYFWYMFIFSLQQNIDKNCSVFIYRRFAIMVQFRIYIFCWFKSYRIFSSVYWLMVSTSMSRFVFFFSIVFLDSMQHVIWWSETTLVKIQFVWCWSELFINMLSISVKLWAVKFY